MKKVFSFLAVALTVSACSTSPHSPDNQAEFTPVDKFHQHIILKPGDRNPAEAPDLSWQPAKFTLTVQGVSSGQYQVNSEVDQVMTWTEDQPFPDTRYEYQDVLNTNAKCDDLICPQGHGESAIWNSYYTSNNKAKIDILTKAINGIGEKSATALVQGNYFSKKPRSWSDFSDEINRAANNGVIQKGVATTVIYTNGALNAQTLGYSAQDCHVVTRTCSRWDSQLVPIHFTNHRQVKQSRVEQSKNFNIQIAVSNAKLLPFENDNLSFNIDENGAVTVDDEAGTFNTYRFTSSVAGNNVTLNVVGDRRNLVDLSSKIVQRDNLVMVDGKVVDMVVDVDPRYIPTRDSDPSAQLTLDYVIQTCEYGWTGTCGFSSWKTFKTGSVPVTTARTTLPFRVGDDLPMKNKVQITYTLTRRSSDYFSSKPTNYLTTTDVKLPKR